MMEMKLQRHWLNLAVMNIVDVLQKFHASTIENSDENKRELEAVLAKEHLGSQKERANVQVQHNMAQTKARIDQMIELKKKEEEQEMTFIKGIVCDDAGCGRENHCDAKFCDACGKRLDLSPKRNERSFETPGCELVTTVELQQAVSIMGFKLSQGLQLRNSDVNWQMLRDTIDSRLSSMVKHEVQTVDISDVYFIQKNCSSHFHNGRSLD